MEAFTEVSSVPVSLPDSDIDTDIIFPARFLLITGKVGLGRYAFYERRYGPGGRPRADFPLNQDGAASASILIAGDNFGGGSSREQAVWALYDLGLRCVISTSFGEIFYSSSFKNGLLPIIVSPAVLTELQSVSARKERLIVSLVDQTIVLADGGRLIFEVEAWRREALLNGWDEVTTILNTQAPAIGAFETAQRQASPWLYADLKD